MAFATEFNALNGGITYRIAAVFKAAATRAACYRVYNKTVSELSAFSNRDLSDLGLSRSDIKRTALEAAYGK